MKRGEIWLVGRHPVLIVSPEAFNRATKVPVVLPISSRGNFARTAGFAVPLAGAGTKTTGVVRCDQPRALDVGARNGRKLEAVSEASSTRSWRGSRRFLSNRTPKSGSEGPAQDETQATTEGYCL
jgi:mRNA-degrading endonuclease toxin of MazEF toxin-antitoxin module